jgi:hypothetical protein
LFRKQIVNFQIIFSKESYFPIRVDYSLALLIYPGWDGREGGGWISKKLTSKFVFLMGDDRGSHCSTYARLCVGCDEDGRQKELMMIG